MVTMTAAAFAAGTVSGAASTVGTTDAFLPLLFRANNIPGSSAQNNYQNRNQDNIFHRIPYFFPLSAYSAFSLLSARTHSQIKTAAYRATKISPPMNPAPKDPVVISVPI